jgi:hypothetical protein
MLSLQAKRSLRHLQKSCAANYRRGLRGIFGIPDCVSVYVASGWGGTPSVARQNALDPFARHRGYIMAIPATKPPIWAQ